MSIKNKNDIYSYIESLNEFKLDFTLSRVKKALKLLKNPQDSYDVIHVAGSNGKGSVSSYLSSILAAHGYKTGLYTSPHLSSVRERVSLFVPPKAQNSKPKTQNCDEVVFEEQAKKLQKLLKNNGMKLTYFEFLTVLSFMIFKKEKVDVAVVEAGLGGRLDATNMNYKKKILSIITSISLEHTDYLGDSLLSILKEKAEINGKEKIVANVAKPELVKYLNKRCGKNLVLTQDVYKIDSGGLKVNGEGLTAVLKHKKSELELKIRTQMPEKVQAENLRTVYTCLEVLAAKGYSFNSGETAKAIESVKVPGRLSKNNKGHYLSVAHNTEGILAAVDTVRDINKGKKMVYLFSLLADKDIAKTAKKLSLIKGLKAVATKIDNERAMDVKKIQRYLEKYGIKYYIEEDNKKALKLAEHLSKGGVLLIGGSFYLVSKYI